MASQDVAGAVRAGPATGRSVAELRAVSKQFGGTLANDAVDFDVHSGEVHALLGENGAGKSTLCSILAGLYKPDAGEVLIDGEARVFDSPSDALAAGVGMIYQHFRLVPRFTVVENLFLGHPSTPFVLHRKALERRAAELMERFGLFVHPRARIKDLTVGERQRVEILRMLIRDVRVLVLDEPTAVLTSSESVQLLDVMRRMAAEGRAIVFVSHKLAEVLAVADRFTVMRDGRRVLSAPAGQAGESELAHAMFARDVVPTLSRTRARVAGGGSAAPRDTEASLRVEELSVRGDDGTTRLTAASLAVASGEIVGVAGVAGNGQRELVEAIVGLRRPLAGRVFLSDTEVTTASVRARVDLGLSYVPEDRLHVGVAGGLSIEDNAILRAYWRPPVARGPLVARAAARRLASELIERLDVRGVREDVPARVLSGGNVQRLILARELALDPKTLVAFSPTRGLDLAASARIRELLLAMRDRGGSVLLVSEDLDELFAIADTIAVMYSGRIVATIPRAEASVARVGALMSGLEVAR